jgi:uncharacterized protein YbjT (DUF2867 family)
MKYDNSDLFCSDLPTRPHPEVGKVMVTGATGYIGGRLVPELLARGYQVSVMVRAPSPEYNKRWPGAKIVVADALDINSLESAFFGVYTVYYLIHSLHLGPREFETADIQAAINFRMAAEVSRVKRIIYLGGLGDARTPLSAHLHSRMKIAQELMKGVVPVTVLRAAIIIGSGSASYEIIEHLVKNLPVLFIPAWAKTKCQPISIRDIIKYLVGVLEAPETAGRSFDIGGKDVLTYEAMLKTFAGLLIKKRLLIPSPVSNIGFFAYLASLFTPVPAPITLCLMEGIKNEVVCQNDEIMKYLPLQPITFKEALVRAMSREEQDKIYTRWSDAYPSGHELAIQLGELGDQPFFTSSYSILTPKPASSLFNSICSIGGKEGWFHNNWMWRLRGIIDRILIGVGTSRGRKSASSLQINDVVDFWRVEDLKTDKRLLLRAEMKIPGRAWLEFNIKHKNRKSGLSIRAYYQTQSLIGKIYWYIFLPFHFLIFYNLIKEIEKRS